MAQSDALGIVDDARFDQTTERHKIEFEIAPSPASGEPIRALQTDRSLGGLILEMVHGWAGRDRLRLASSAHRLGRRVWLHWPLESAVECVDRERLSSYWRHWLLITSYLALRRIRQGLRQRSVALLLGALRAGGARAVRRTVAPPAWMGINDWLRQLKSARAAASPVPFTFDRPSSSARLPGVGVYLRLDYWARIESGGSYGHTCYVAKELAAVTGRFVCFMAHRYRLLDEFGIQQVIVDGPASESEDDIVTATPHFLRVLRPAFEAIRPAYIYERICIGNAAGAILSRELSIPYIVEYNGSEISMRRSFDGTGYVYEDEYLEAEELAFAQATMISVVSEEVKKSLVARGVAPDKILVNPNGADLESYAPATAEEKSRLRSELGFAADDVVIGFTGTFGGWHGVDVLAAALPRISAAAPNAQFLLIGDGNFRHLVEDAVARHGLEQRVRRVGRVPQAEGARLLKACDIFVSPHSSHMIDSRFFGSPTKIFEYMAMGGGVVASDLEQIGQILSPALTAHDLDDRELEVTDERAVLCEPGNVNDFADAVVRLSARADLWPVLGRNARAAVEQHYSWARHVARLWPFLRGERAQENLPDLRRKARTVRAREMPVPAPALATVGAGGAGGEHVPMVSTSGDRYKAEVQKQWDNDPAGSHYVKHSQPHTLDWFLEAEAYRYGEYAPWMAQTMEFAGHGGVELLEIGGGMGTDLAQFAKNGARVTDLDLSSGHLELARENLRLRGLSGRFVLQDAETIDFPDATFDVVYSNGVIHHTPNTQKVVREIYRVLKPGGRAIVMVYAENSLHYWRNLVWTIGLKEKKLFRMSMGEIMSRSVERSDNARARPLVKVYTKKRARQMFRDFERVEVMQRQMVAAEVPRLLTWVPLPILGKVMGWNLVIKARKPPAKR